LIRIDYAFQKVLSNIVILNYDVFLELVHLNNEKENIEEEKRVVEFYLRLNVSHLMIDDKNDEFLRDHFHILIELFQERIRFDWLN